MSQRQIDEQRAFERTLDAGLGESGTAVYGPVGSLDEHSSSTFTTPEVQWAGTTNTVTATKVGNNPSWFKTKTKNQTITKWLRATSICSYNVSTENGESPLQHLGHPKFPQPTPVGVTVRESFNDSFALPRDGDTSHPCPQTSTPRRNIPNKDQTLYILKSLEQNSLESSPAKKRRKLDSFSSNETTDSFLTALDPNNDRTEDTLSFQRELENYLKNESLFELENRHTKENFISPNVCFNEKQNLQTDITNCKPFSSEQVETLLPKQAEQTWTNAKIAHLEGLRFTQRAAFLKGALQSNIIEDWALQLERLPSFLMKIADFRTDFHKLRVGHARETMQLAARYLEDTAKEDKSRAKALKGAAIVFTKGNLGEDEAKSALAKAYEDWDSNTKRTIAHEHKLLEDRKAKLEGKPFSFTDVIDPMGKGATKTATETSTSANRGRGDFGRRGRSRGRGRGRRGRASESQARSSPKNKK